MRITNDFKTRSSVQIFQIGERELIAANWRLKEKSKSLDTGNWTLCIRME